MVPRIGGGNECANQPEVLVRHNASIYAAADIPLDIGLCAA